MNFDPTDEEILADQDDVQKTLQWLLALGYTENKKARSYRQLGEREFLHKTYDLKQYQQQGYACKFVLNGGSGFRNCYIEYRFDFDGKFLGHAAEEETIR